ncbi:unnamed protein product [Allacma fusca]|uniref:Uncharacterized protein n=1 Tax=Allacma fusca TaxID=39272 RepID=A0A8J2JD65_9HEXA|nr:unnamed protein product [Allacma fusca]
MASPVSNIRSPKFESFYFSCWLEFPVRGNLPRSAFLNNPKYSTNMKAMSALFRDRPKSPIETGVYWTEFVLRHNNTRHLKPIQNLTFFQRRFFDGALILILVVSFILALLFASLFRGFPKKPYTKDSITKDGNENKKKLH